MEETTIQGKYKLIKKIGSGGFSTVWLGEHIVTKHKCAIKEITPDKMSDDCQKYIIKEIAIMKKLQHPFISTFFDTFTDNEKRYIVMEYADQGSLSELFKTTGRMSELVAKKYIIQIIIVLDYLHNDKRVVHRDLKPENILIGSSGNILLSDFGLSSEFSIRDPMLHTACGSPLYAAPELIHANAYSNKVDVWSLGVILYRMIVGSFPFENDNIKVLYNLILTSQPKYPSFVSPVLIDLLKKLLSKDPDIRPSIDMIKKHQWFYGISHDNFTAPTIDCGLDYDIIKKLQSLGLDTLSLSKEILTNESNYNTAAYWMEWTDKKAQIVLKWEDDIMSASQKHTARTTDCAPFPRRQFNFTSTSPAPQVMWEAERSEKERSPLFNAPQVGQRILKIPTMPSIVSRRASRPVAVRKSVFSEMK